MNSSTHTPDCFGWRRYSCPTILHRHVGPSVDPACRDYLIWFSADEGQHPHLARWEGMAKAFMGFVSRGYGPCIATAYSLPEVFNLIKSGELLYRSWQPGGDAAEAAEFVKMNLLGVWMGEHTPFMVDVSDSWDTIIAQNLKDFV